MTADIEQDDLFFRNKESECYPVTERKTYCMATFKPADQGMEGKARLKRIDLQVGNHFGEAGFEVGMLFEEFARVA
jgi:hypothetical protein